MQIDHCYIYVIFFSIVKYQPVLPGYCFTTAPLLLQHHYSIVTLVSECLKVTDIIPRSLSIVDGIRDLVESYRVRLSWFAI